jgi:hypothetical protein
VKGRLPVSSEARVFLRRLGAESLAHPGGTLLAHLERVRLRLAAWGAREELQRAGLCHACYGTDGFPAALLPPDRRADLTAVIGTEAEEIVYAYGRCDRAGAYAALTEPGAPLRDRFTGRAFVPGPRLRRDLAELTAANELDLAWEDQVFRERWGPDLLELFTRLRPLLSDAAWQDCAAVLGGAPAE